MGALLDALQFAGNVLDTPGSIARGLLAGDPSRAMHGILDPSQRVSGRDMLESWGALAPNQEGLDLGDALGFGAEMLTDPLNWLGGVGALKALRSPVRRTMSAPGVMADDIAKLTRVVDDAGDPLRVFHGTGRDFGAFDMGKADPAALFGKGFYATTDPEIAATYATARSDVLPESVRSIDNTLEHLAKVVDPEGPYQRLGRTFDNFYTARYPDAPADVPGMMDYLKAQRDSMIPRPVIRTHRLDIRNPFDAEAMYRVSDLPAAGWMEGTPKDAVIPGRDFFQMSRSRENARRALQEAGFDGLKYQGGNYAAFGQGPLHDVYITWNPDQIYSGLRPTESMANPATAPLLSAIAGHNSIRPWGE